MILDSEIYKSLFSFFHNGYVTLLLLSEWMLSLDSTNLLWQMLSLYYNNLLWNWADTNLSSLTSKYNYSISWYPCHIRKGFVKLYKKSKASETITREKDFSLYRRGNLISATHMLLLLIRALQLLLASLYCRALYPQASVSSSFSNLETT